MFAEGIVGWCHSVPLGATAAGSRLERREKEKNGHPGCVSTSSLPISESFAATYYASYLAVRDSSGTPCKVGNANDGRARGLPTY